MLHSLRTISRLVRPLQSSHARFLTTLPKPIPTYLPQWDPTRRIPLKVVPTEPRDVARDDARKRERAQLCRSKNFEMPSLDADPEHVNRDETNRLNGFLRLADEEPGLEGLHMRLWEIYRRLKKRDSKFVYSVPDEAWDLMWKLQEREPHKDAVNPRLVTLRKDMHKCRRYEPVGCRVQYLDGLFQNGHEEQALEEWEEDRQGTNNLSRHDYKPEHLELGARMFAIYGDPDRSREIMEELFELHPTYMSSVAKTVFRAHTSSDLVQHHDMAKKMYKDYKGKSGEDMVLEDYDAFFIGFLEARHLINAKMVFRDMIRGHRLATSYLPEEVEKVLERLHLLYRLATDISKMTTIGLQAISALPEAYHAHVFGQWMRSALAMNAPNAAAQLLDLMFNHGFRPQTNHFNLLLKTLMRSDDVPNISNAENIGWRMIEEARKASTKYRRAPASETISKWTKKMITLLPGEETKRDVPKANVTTFAIMIKHHASKLQWEHVDYLTRRLKESGLQPDSDLMDILMDIKCRQGKFREVWEIYKSLTDVPEGTVGVFPGGSSMRCLWKTLRLALEDPATRGDPDLPRPRELLAETVQWWKHCQARHDAERFLIGLTSTDRGALSTLIIHCFSYTNDIAGSLVGLHILRKQFGILLSDQVPGKIHSQAAWVDLNHITEHERSRFIHNSVYKKNLEKLGHVYDMLLERRKQRLGISEDDYAQLSVEERNDLGLNTLSEFIRVIMKRSDFPESVEAMIDHAKEQAGVPDMSTGDMDAFQVA